MEDINFTIEPDQAEIICKYFKKEKLEPYEIRQKLYEIIYNLEVEK